MEIQESVPTTPREQAELYIKVYSRWPDKFHKEQLAKIMDEDVRVELLKIILELRGKC